MRELMDTFLDRSVLPGYSRLGYALRRRGWSREDPRSGVLSGRIAVVTGANSGLGKATTRGLAELGARVHLLVRNRQRGEQAVDDLAQVVPRERLVVEVCDLSDLDDVARTAQRLAVELPRLDVVVHNAGVMPPQRSTSAQGHELSVATHVLGPIRLTEGLLPVLSGHDARVILVSSGGLYTQPLRDDDPEYEHGDYRGAIAYARSKRMQVSLLPELRSRWAAAGISVHAMHPGWANTPGVVSSLPGFYKLTRPLLRTAQEGADTIIWLAATDPAPPGGRFWQDRAPRPTHYLRRTRERPGAVESLWSWVAGQLALDS